MSNARTSRTEICVLVAMLTRGRAMVRKPSGAWFVPGWNHPDVPRGRAGLMVHAGLLAAGTRDGVLVLTGKGRDVALNACTPETRTRLAA